MKGTVDHVAARELLLFIQNDKQLYRQEVAIDKNLRQKLKRGVFDKALAVKLFMYLADAGAIKYVSEFTKSNADIRTNSNSMFGRKTRFAVAATLTKLWIDARRNDGLYINPVEAVSCEVCGKTGAAAKACRFEKGCSCWRGVPCGTKKNPLTNAKARLVYAKTGKPVKVGDKLRDFRGDMCKVTAIPRPPHSRASEGHIELDGQEYYAGVGGAVWINRDDGRAHKNPISKRFAHRVTAATLREAERRGYINPMMAFESSKWRPYCENCGQWQTPKPKEKYLDCFNECARRGFERKETLTQLKKRIGH